MGFGMYIPHVHICHSRRLPDGISIFPAELVALLWALWWVEEGGSLSALMALGELRVAELDRTLSAKF